MKRSDEVTKLPETVGEPAEPTEPTEPAGPTEGRAGSTETDWRAEPTERRSDGARRSRPLIERIGMAFIALVLAVLFAAVAVAAFSGGEPFLAVMGAIGCLMTLWVGGLTLFRG